MLITKMKFFSQINSKKGNIIINLGQSPISLKGIFLPNLKVGAIDVIDLQDVIKLIWLIFKFYLSFFILQSCHPFGVYLAFCYAFCYNYITPSGFNWQNEMILRINSTFYLLPCNPVIRNS